MLGKLFVGFDLETGSPFDQPETERKILTELGAVKYVYTKEGFKPVAIFSELINEGKGVHPDCIEYTGITPKLIEDFGRPLKETIISFLEFVDDCDFLVSHNGERFDIPVLKEAFKHVGIETPKFLNTTSIDTMICVPYPANCKSKNLTYLQAFHGFVNPFPHRAFADVMAMMKVLGNYNIEEVVKVAESPTVRYTAVFTYPSEKRFPSNESFQHAMADFNKKKDAVKNAGFQWRPESKKWIYEGKELIFKRDIEPSLPCKVIKLGDDNGNTNADF